MYPLDINELWSRYLSDHDKEWLNAHKKTHHQGLWDAVACSLAELPEQSLDVLLCGCFRDHPKRFYYYSIPAQIPKADYLLSVESMLLRDYIRCYRSPADHKTMVFTTPEHDLINAGLVWREKSGLQAKYDSILAAHKAKRKGSIPMRY